MNLFYITTIVVAVFGIGIADAKRIIPPSQTYTDRVCVNRCIGKYGYNFPPACYADCVRRGR